MPKPPRGWEGWGAGLSGREREGCMRRAWWLSNVELKAATFAVSRRVAGHAGLTDRQHWNRQTTGVSPRDLP